MTVAQESAQRTANRRCSLSESVSRDMLADLERKFAGDGTTREKCSVGRPGRKPLTIQHGAPLNLELPGIRDLPNRLAINGCSTDSEGIGAYAAITGNGRVVVGYFICPTVNVQIAELQAVRFGLHELDVDSAEVLLANARVADSLRRIAAGKPVRHLDVLPDRNGIRDVARSARRIDIQVRQINGIRTTIDLMPDHPLLGIPSRLSHAACRLAVSGVPFDTITREWLREVGCSSGRRRYSLQRRCDRFIARRNQPS